MCASAQEALDYLEQGRPDVIFMDHLMPEMDGLEAMAKIKSNPATSHLPVVMCTGKEGDNYEETVKQAGAVGFLPKPPEPEHLERVLGIVSAQAAAGVPAAAPQVEPAAAVADTGEIQVQLEALEHKLLSALHERIDTVKSEFEAHKAELLGNATASESDAVSSEFNAKLESLHGRTEEINKLFGEFEARVGSLSTDVESLRGEVADPSDQSSLMARLEALEASAQGGEVGAGLTEDDLPDAIRRLLPDVIEFSPDDLAAMRSELDSIRSVVSEQGGEPEAVDLSEVETRIEQKVGQLVTALDEKVSASLATVEEQLASVANQPVAESTGAEMDMDAIRREMEELSGKAVEARLESIFTQQQAQISDLRNSIRAEVDKAVGEQSLPVAEESGAEQSQEAVELLSSEIGSLRKQLAAAQGRNTFGLILIAGGVAVALAKAFGAF